MGAVGPQLVAHRRPRDDDEEWKLRAACRTAKNPDLWFPDQGNREAARGAVTICIDCPVAKECLQYATANRIPYGIWGGLRQTDRPHGITAYRRAGHFW